MRLEVAGESHPGLVRPDNEDAVMYRSPDDHAVTRNKGMLFAIADGVGAYAGGDTASRTAVEVLASEYYSPRAPGQIEACLGVAMQAANLHVINLGSGVRGQGSGDEMREATGGGQFTTDIGSLPSGSRPQTTLTAMVLAGAQGYVAHAGDCRLYLLRDSRLSRITSDHSEAAELARLGLISTEQAQTHPRRSVLTRTLGSTRVLRPDFQRFSVQAGDRLLLCTDGLWSDIDDEALAGPLGWPPAAACDALVQMACARGGGDNISLVVVHVIDPGLPPAPTPGRISRLLSSLRGG
ncbi:MAG TPA: protein phosphatase 2C domain-containing protein [Chloroflexota bacterium]|nr:protein phosphatase 2C domain-containing protein [Chloroflexota bacterium]